MSEITLTDQNWDEEVLNSTLPVIVDFWAEWCMPCRMISPIVEEISNEYGDKIKVGKLNVDENPSVAGRYGITGIPTVLFFKNGDIVDQVVGAVPKRFLENVVKKVLNE